VNYDLIVIGEGIAGLTAAGEAAKRGLRVATFEGNLFGGLVINIAELEDWTGTASGVDLASQLMEANAGVGVTSVSENVTGIAGARGAFRVTTDAAEHAARAVIIAAGARLNHLDVPGESEFDHRGVSQCADCDGPMFQNEHVVVVGGGDAAFQEAATLAKYAAKVTLLMRGEAPRARAALVEHARSNPKIAIVPRTNVEAITGGQMVEGITVRGPAGAERLACAGVFVFIGVTPNGECAPAAVQRSAGGHLVTSDAFETAVPGLFAVGAVRAGYSGRLVDAVAEAKSAAQSVAQMLGSE